MADTYHAIVIGSGLAGLSAAFELTGGKRRVLIIEAASQVGGRTSNWKDGGMDVESVSINLSEFTRNFRAYCDAPA